MEQIKLIENMLDDYFRLQQSNVDNTDCISPRYYDQAYARIDKERTEVAAAMQFIKTQLGVEE